MTADSPADHYEPHRTRRLLIEAIGIAALAAQYPMNRRTVQRIYAGSETASPKFDRRLAELAVALADELHKRAGFLALSALERSHHAR